MSANIQAVEHALSKFHSAAPKLEEPDQLRLSLLELAQSYLPHQQKTSAASQLVNSLFHYDPLDLTTLGLDQCEAVFARNLQRLKPSVMSAGNIRPSRSSISTDESEDCIAEDATSWPVLKVLNLAIMSCLPPRKRIAVVTSVRNEGASFLEWLAHCRATGLESLFIYTNDNTDGSGDLLKTLADFGIINLIENKVGANVKIQAKILEHSLHLLPELRDYEWVFFIDVDEFFVPRCEPGLTLDSFFDHFQRAFHADAPSAICFNWKWFGSENAFEATEGLLMERFIYSIHNEHVKSLVRLKDVVSMQRVHVPVLALGAWCVNSAFEQVDPAIQIKPTYGKGQLNHYWNKSFQEFVLKRARGRISGSLSGSPLDLSTFFDWGANGRRGNLDYPDERVIKRLKKEYLALTGIRQVAENLATIRSCQRQLLSDLTRDLDIASIYNRQGRST